MRIRFVQTVPSDSPDLPFQPGQIIAVPKLTSAMKRWLKDGQAVLLHDEPETAVVASPERAVAK